MKALDWLRRKLAGEDVQLYFREGEEEFSGLNMKQAIDAHMAWRRRLEAAVQGTSRETLAVSDVAADHLCTLGKWIHGTAKAKYGQLPEYRELNQSHAAFHLLAGEVLKEHRRGNREMALRLLRVGLRETSEQVQLNIIRLYARATG
jgi:hypothetical protein